MSIADAPVSPVATVVPESKLSPDDLRRQRGLAIAALSNVRAEGRDNRYRVPSQTGLGHYLVCIDRKKGPDWRCDCDDFETRGEPCKHIFAVKFVIEREKQAEAEAKSPPSFSDRARRQTFAEQEALAAEASPERPTYKQDWPAYNAAQTTEKHRFQEFSTTSARASRSLPGRRGASPAVASRSRGPTWCSRSRSRSTRPSRAVASCAT